LKTKFSASVATVSTVVDVRPETPIQKFPSILSFTMSLNTYLVKGSYLLIEYDPSQMTASLLENISC
jgi:hypothetical protein